MNVETLTFWMTVAQFVGLIGLAVGGYYLRTAFVPRKEYNGWTVDAGNRMTMQSERMTVIDGRFTVMEFKLTTLPTPVQIEGLKEVIANLRADVRVLTERLDARENLEPLIRAIEELARKDK